MAISLIVLVVLVVLAAGIGGIVWQSGQSRDASARPIQRISPNQYQTGFIQTERPHMLVDVRTPEEFASGHIAGAVNLALPELPRKLDTLPTDQPIVLYCRSGARSNTAAQILARAGYADVYDLGGINDWRGQGHAIQTGAPNR